MPQLKKKPASRQGVRVNYGNIPGTFAIVPMGESTHLYAAETLDGKNWFAFPTLFQDPDGTWVDMSEQHEKGDWMPVYEEAKKRGEVIDFGENKEEAIRFGEGSWKDKEMSSGGYMPQLRKNRSTGTQVVKKDPPKAGTAFFGAYPDNAVAPEGYEYTESLELVPEGWSEYHSEKDGLDLDALKRGISMAESLGGVLMMNPESSATGMYGQLWNEVKNMPELKGYDREKFSKDIEKQEEIFNIRVNDGIGGPSLMRNAVELTEEYAPQLGDSWDHSLEEVAALTNYLGRQGARNYYAARRDGTKYKPPGTNLDPDEYIRKFRAGVASTG